MDTTVQGVDIKDFNAKIGKEVFFKEYPSLKEGYLFYLTGTP